MVFCMFTRGYLNCLDDLMRSFLTNLGIFRRFRRDDHDGLILNRLNSDSR
jgi:hypothetical protein